MRDRREARAHGVEKEKWEREAGGGGRVARWGPAKRPSFQPSPAAPRLPAALRSRPDPPRFGFRRLGARRAQNVASDRTPAPRALALGAGAADPGWRGAVPRRPAAQAPREARIQEQVSARPPSSPADGEAPSQSPRPPPAPPDPSPGPEAELSGATSSNQGFPSSCLGQRLL